MTFKIFLDYIMVRPNLVHIYSYQTCRPTTKERPKRIRKSSIRRRSINQTYSNPTASPSRPFTAHDSKFLTHWTTIVPPSPSSAKTSKKSKAQKKKIRQQIGFQRKMVYTYTPTYYTSLQESISSICKNVLPFSFKKRRLPAIAEAEQRLSKQQSDNLKWQQDSFHRVLNLTGLYDEGIASGNEVSAFRTHLLETLIASPLDHEPALVLRDKLIFLKVSELVNWFFTLWRNT